MKGTLLYSALIAIIALFIVGMVVAEVFSYLLNAQWKSRQEEMIYVNAESTVKEAINYVQSYPYEELNAAEGIHDDLETAKFPDEYKMVSTQCGFVATLISFAQEEVIYEIWARCKFNQQEKIEKVKVKLTTGSL